MFGVTLDEAVSATRISEIFELPAVVYRCIEYLDFKEGERLTVYFEKKVRSSNTIIFESLLGRRNLSVVGKL